MTAAIVTTIEPLGDWYPAEDYHQDYWAGKAQRNPYCIAVIPPKLPEAPQELPGAAQERKSLRLRRGGRGCSRSLIAAPRPSPGIGATAIRGFDGRVGKVEAVEQLARRLRRGRPSG